VPQQGFSFRKINDKNLAEDEQPIATTAKTSGDRDEHQIAHAVTLAGVPARDGFVSMFETRFSAFGAGR
jgi:hypothetical protein